MKTLFASILLQIDISPIVFFGLIFISGLWLYLHFTIKDILEKKSQKPVQPTDNPQETLNGIIDQEWKTKSDQIKARDNYKCRYCGSSENLQVHYKYYIKLPNGNTALPSDYPDNAFITLCEKCHKKVHENKKIKTYFRKNNK